MSVIDTIKRGATTTKWMGIFLIIAGILAVMSPFWAGLSVSVMVGVLLLFSGFARIFIAFRAGMADGWVLGLVGALTVAVGGYLLARPGAALLSLTLALAMYFIVVGIVEAIAAFGARPTEGWWWILFGAVVTVLLGLMIWRQFPLSGAWAIGTLVGVRMIFTGWAFVTIGGTVKRAAKAASA